MKYKGSSFHLRRFRVLRFCRVGVGCDLFFWFGISWWRSGFCFGLSGRDCGFGLRHDEVEVEVCESVIPRRGLPFSFIRPKKRILIIRAKPLWYIRCNTFFSKKKKKKSAIPWMAEIDSCKKQLLISTIDSKKLKNLKSIGRTGSAGLAGSQN